MARTILGLAVAAAISLVAVGAGAHIKLTDPPQRYVYTLDGQKPGPCGSGSVSGIVTTYAPGQTVLVQWDETINHPGHFRISLDPDGGDDGLVDPTDYDDFYVAPSVLVDDIPDMGGNQFSQEITLPMQECAKCTLQLIQVMTDKPPWGPAGGNELYYWCADIAISASGAGGSSSSAAATTSGAGAGATSGGNGGSTSSDDDDGGSSSEEEGGCAVARTMKPRSGTIPALALIVAFAVVRRRRRRS